MTAAGTPTKLVITGGFVWLQQCQLYRGHLHRQPVLDVHHICPEDAGLTPALTL